MVVPGVSRIKARRHRAAHRFAPRRSRVRRAAGRCAAPSAGTGSMRGAARAPGGSSAGTRPTGLSTSTQRSRAASCGCAQTSAMLLTRALAICAASSLRLDLLGGQRAKAASISSRSATRSALRARVGGEARVGRRVRAGRAPACRTPAIRARSAGRASRVRPSPVGNGPYGIDRRVRRAGARRRLGAVEGVVQRIAHPLDHALEHRDVDAPCRGRCGRARSAPPGCWCTHTCRRRCRRSSSRPWPARRASR